MDTNFLLKLLEKGIIDGLFVLIVVFVIWKAIPYAFRKFEQLNEEHKREMEVSRKEFSESLDKQTKAYEQSLMVIVENFKEATETSKKWHEKHNQSLQEIKTLINTK